MLKLEMPKEITVQAQGFDEFILHYLSTKEGEVHPGSMRGYQSQVQPFITWWRDNAADFDYQLTERLFDAYFEWYRTEFRSGKTKKPASRYMINSSGAMLRRILRWAHAKGAISQDVSELVRIHEYNAPPQYFPTLDDVYAIMHVPSDQLRMRDAAYMGLLASTGCRRVEGATLQVNQVHFFESDWHDLRTCSDHTGYLYVQSAKGGRPRYAVFDSVCGLLLKSYRLAWGIDAGELFPVSAMAMYNRVMKHAESAGVPDFHPHSFRHAFNDLWLEENAQFGEISDVARRLQLGHALSSGDSNSYHYQSWRSNEQKLIERLRKYHVSPLLKLAEAGRWDWTLWPVHHTE